jgi:hypothetical protein
MMLPPPPLVVRFVSQFDNATFWGGIEDCTVALKQAKADAKAKKRAAKAEKKKQKEQAKVLRQVEKDQKQQLDDDDTGTSSSTTSISALMVAWMGGTEGGFVTSGLPLFIELIVAAMLGVWVSTVVVHRVRKHLHPNSNGYHVVNPVVGTSSGRKMDGGTDEERTALLTV